MSTKRKIVLELDAQTTGADGVKGLADEIAKLAKSGGDAAPEFQRLSDELNQLSTQQRTVDTFRALAQEVDNSRAALDTARESVREQAAAVGDLKRQYDTAKVALDEQADAMREAKARVEATKAAYSESKAAVSAYVSEIGDARRANEEERKALESKREAQRRSKAEYDAAKASLDALTPKYTELKNAASGIASELTKQEAALRKSTASADAAEGAYEEYASALGQVQKQASALGVDLSDVEREQNRLTSAIATATSEYGALSDRLRTTGSSTDDLIEAQRQSAVAAQKAAEYTRWWADALSEADLAARRLEQTRIDEEQRQAAVSAQKAAEYTRWWADALDEADRAAADTAKRAKGLQDAFDTLSTRSSRATDAIRAEIMKVSQAMLRLAQDTTVTGADFNKAFANGQARIRELEGKLRSAGTEAKKMGSEFKDAFRNFGPATVVFNTVTAGINALVDAARNIPRVTAEFQTMERTLRIITGSAEGARKEFEFLRGVANRTGQGIVELAKAYGSLSAATKGTAQEGAMTRRVFEAVAGAMGTLGKSAADTELALQAVQQMVSKGVVSMEEFRQQLGERLPGVLQVTAKNLNITTAELNDLISSGQMTVDDLFPAMAAGLEDLYKTGEANTTLLGQWNAWMNAIKETGAALGNSGILQALLQLGKVGVAVPAAAAEAFVLLGKGIGATAAAITTGDFKGAWQGFRAELDAADKRMSALVSSNKDAVPTMRQLALEAEKNGKAFFTTADGMKIATTAVLNTSDAMVKFAVESAKAQRAAEDQATSARKLAEYTRSAGEMAITTANAIGDENDKRKTATTVATNNAAALDNLLAKEQAVLDVLAERARVMQEDIRQSGAVNANRAKAVEALQGEIDKQQTVVAGIKQQTTAAKALAAALDIETEALKNNAASVDALTADYAEFTRALEVVRAEVDAGRMTQQQAAVVEQAALRTKALLKDAIDDEAFALQTLAKLTGDEKAAKEASILTAQRQLTLLQQTGQARTDAATKLQAEITQLQLERQALEDNAGKLVQYRTEYENAKAAVEALTAAKAAGKAVDDELAAAQQRLAEATVLYRDATKDSVAAIEAQNAAKQSQMSLAQATVSLALEEARAAYEVAKAKGNEGAAARALVDVKRLERELAILSAEAKRMEAQAAVAVARAKIDEIRASGNLNAAKRAEIAALEASIRVKQLESQIAGVTAQKLRDLAQATGETERAAVGAIGATDQYAGSVERLGTEADITRQKLLQLQQLQQQQPGGGGENGGGGGTPPPGSGPKTYSRKYGPWDVLVAKAEELGGPAYRKQIEQRLSSASGVVGMAGGSPRFWQEIGRISKELKVAEDAAKQAAFDAKDSSVGGASPPPSSVAPPPAVSGQTYSVNVNLGGRTQTINTASQSDAQALVGLLKNLETASGAAY